MLLSKMRVELLLSLSTVAHPPTRPLLVRRPAMQVNAKPAAAPGDGTPGSEEPALIKMNNQHSKLDLAMPVRTHNGHRAVPYGSGLCAPRCAASLTCAAKSLEA